MKIKTGTNLPESHKSKVRVYVDGANLFYAQKDLGWIFDWRKVKKLLEKTFEADKFAYYTPLRKEKRKQVQQILRLERWGYQVITKPPKRLATKFKANFDVEISIDIILDLVEGWPGDIVILSGDSDFSYLIKIVHKRFKRKVYIFSTRRFLSWEVNYVADECCLLEDYKDEIYLKNWVLTKMNRYVIKVDR